MGITIAANADPLSRSAITVSARYCRGYHDQLARNTARRGALGRRLSGRRCCRIAGCNCRGCYRGARSYHLKSGGKRPLQLLDLSSDQRRDERGAGEVVGHLVRVRQLAIDRTAEVCTAVAVARSQVRTSVPSSRWSHKRCRARARREAARVWDPTWVAGQNPALHWHLGDVGPDCRRADVSLAR